MSVTPGPWATPSSIAERTGGRRAGIEHRVEVADQQDPRSPGPPVERGDDRVAEPAGGVGPIVDLGAERGEEVARPAAHLVDARPACSSRSRC